MTASTALWLLVVFSVGLIIGNASGVRWAQRDKTRYILAAYRKAQEELTDAITKAHETVKMSQIQAKFKEESAEADNQQAKE